MNNIKKLLLMIISIFILFPVFSKEQISINVGDETFVKDMPENYEEACEMIKLLADMYNDANDEINKLSLNSSNSSSEAVNKLVEVEKELAKAKIDLNNIKTSNTQLEKKVKELLSVNNRFIFGFGFGPAFDIKDSSIGTHVEFIGNFRLIKNFHLGSTLYLDTYSNINKFNVGASLVASFGLY